MFHVKQTILHIWWYGGIISLKLENELYWACLTTRGTWWYGGIEIYLFYCGEVLILKVKLCEVVTKVDFLKEDIINEVLNKSCIRDYAYIIHHSDRKEDGSLKDAHYHICIRFKDAYDTKYIAQWFNIGEQFISKVKGRWSDVLKYLTHANAPTKFQYSVDEVVSNFDFKKEINKNNNKDIVNDIIKQIEAGEIREYNQFDKIPIEIWSRNKTLIKNALEYYREMKFMEKDREITVIFCTGDTGTGKTTFAKEYAKMTKKSICISSCSNDVMQDYKGEDVIVLDDMRDDSFKFTDLLKILDNHTKSTMASRYFNKGFLGDTIIITSYKDVEEWYKEVPDESRCQLFRRISLKCVFTDDFVYGYHWEDDIKKYVVDSKVKNIYRMKAREKAKTSMDLFKVMGSLNDEEYDKAIKDIDSLDDEQLELMVNDTDNPFCNN